MSRKIIVYEEFDGMKLKVFGTPVEDPGDYLPIPPFTIRDPSHLEELLLAGLASPKEEVEDQEWIDLCLEVRRSLQCESKKDESPDCPVA